MVAQHLWVALSPHGYGHAAMTSQVVVELCRRRPELRLTIQTALPHDFLVSRYGPDFTHVPAITDFGLRMTSSTSIALEDSAEDYRRLHADWPGAVAVERERLAAGRPDLVLANIPYVTIAAATALGIPVVALCSLNWADIYRHYLGDRPESAAIIAEMTAAYNAAQVFLRPEPAMPMPHFTNLRDIGPVARQGRAERSALRSALGPAEEPRVGLICLGGIDHPLPLAELPRLPGWVWLTSGQPACSRDDIRPWESAGLGFSDLLASVDVVVTKPGYGTFTEAGLAGTPVLTLGRPDWPETPALMAWLKRHTRTLETTLEEVFSARLEQQLRSLFSLPRQQVACADGVEQAAGIIAALLDGETL